MSGAVTDRRNRLVEETFPHLDALWQSALWLFQGEHLAEALVLDSMRKACCEWHLPSNSPSDKARLFRFFAIEFLGFGTREHHEPPQGILIPEIDAKTTTYQEMSPQDVFMTMESRRQLLITDISNEPVKGAVFRLMPLARLMFVLLLRERFSYREIAYIVDLGMASVKKMLNRLHYQIPYLLRQNNILSTTDADRWENEGGTLAAESGRA